jgi:hypothetical protein
MSTSRPMPPQRVPTLTEVVEPMYRAPPPVEPLPDGSQQPPQESWPTSPPEMPHEPSHEAPAHPDTSGQGSGDLQAIDEAELIDRVLSDLQRQVELMLEYRLREVLTPALVRATDALIRDARVELASTLRDVVARAVAQELSRHRGR